MTSLSALGGVGGREGQGETLAQPAGFLGLPSSLWAREGPKALGPPIQASRAAKWDTQAPRGPPSPTCGRTSFLALICSHHDPRLVCLGPPLDYPLHERWPSNTGNCGSGMLKIYRGTECICICYYLWIKNTDSLALPKAASSAGLSPQVASSESPP